MCTCLNQSHPKKLFGTDAKIHHTVLLQDTGTLLDQDPQHAINRQKSEEDIVETCAVPPSVRKVCTRLFLYSAVSIPLVGNVTECTNYRGIKLMCHGMKLYERLVEDRLRQVIEISSTQYGFQQGKSTTEPIFALRMMLEKHLEKRKNLHLCRS